MNAGWYPDPDDANARRYWDGESWSAPLPIAVATPPVVDHTPSHPAKNSPLGGRKLWLVGSSAALLIVAAAVLVFVIKHNNDQDEKAAAASASSSVAASSSAAAAAAAASQSSVAAASEAKASQAQEAASIERARRKLIVKSLEKSVTKDARSSVSDGVLDGPIKFTDCTPVGGGSADILTDTTGAFQCLAVTKVSGTTERGYNYSAVVNWTDASYSWHLGS